MFGLQLQPRLQSMADSTKPCWCDTILAGIDLVWCTRMHMHHHAPPTFLACASLESSPWLSSNIYVYSGSKHQSEKQHSESEVPLKSVICMIIHACYMIVICTMKWYLYYFIRIYHQQASVWYCVLSLAHANQ